MTNEEFLRILQNPLELQRIRLEVLEDLAARYPYCHSLRLCLLRKYQHENPTAFEQQLPTEALYAPSRSALYRFLHQQISSLLELSHQNAAPLTPAPVHFVSENPPMLTPEAVAELLAAEDAPEKKTSFETAHQLALGNVRPIAWEYNPHKHHPNGRNGKKRFKLPRIPILEDKSVFDIFETPPTPPAPLTAGEPTDTNGAFTILSNTEAFLKSLAERAQRLEHPRAETPQKHISETLAEQSVTEHDDVISETLADLLAQQGQKEKAAKMYRRLSKQFPEKSHNFAQKIKNLGF